MVKMVKGFLVINHLNHLLERWIAILPETRFDKTRKCRKSYFKIKVFVGIPFAYKNCRIYLYFKYFKKCHFAFNGLTRR